MEMFNLITTILGGLILLLGLVSKWLERSPVPPTLLALLAGIILGPGVTGLIDPAALGIDAAILERAARLTLGIGLVGVALRIPREYPRRSWRTIAVLLGLGMPLMWGISTFLIYAILSVPFGLAALIGAMITATDPIASSPIVTGPTAETNLPERISNAISFESGVNDGLTYLFVFLPLLILTRSINEALSHWLVHTFLWEVGAATFFGLLIGYAAGKLLQWSDSHDAIEGDWRLIYTAAVALFATGFGRLIQSDELLLVFAAGAMFTQVVSGDERNEEELGQEAVNRFFIVPFFALLGMMLPWEGWHALGWSGVLLAVAVLLLRRPPVLLLLRPILPDLQRVSDALFIGWFGPVAVAAVYYASLIEHTHHFGDPVVWHVVSLIVFASVVAHGLTAAPITRLYGRVTGEKDAHDNKPS